MKKMVLVLWVTAFLTSVLSFAEDTDGGLGPDATVLPRCGKVTVSIRGSGLTADFRINQRRPRYKFIPALTGQVGSLTVCGEASVTWAITGGDYVVKIFVDDNPVYQRAFAATEGVFDLGWKDINLNE